MDILVTGTGGARGWPEPGCRCASCLHATAGASEPTRARSTIIVDGVLQLGVVDEVGTGLVAGAGVVAGEGAGVVAAGEGAGVVAAGEGAGVVAAGEGAGVVAAGEGAGVVAAGEGAGVVAGEARAVEGLLVLGLADARGGAAGAAAGEVRGGGSGATLGGWDVTGPDGARLLYPARPGAVPVPPEGARPYDVAFLDVLGDAFQLGGLRARGLVTGDTTVLAAFADHRVRSEAELHSRCGIWGVGVLRDGARVTPCRYEKKGVYRVLVLGGARSGKSERAELRVAAEPDVTYVATGPSGAGDPDWAARVAAHRRRRPSWWRTAETTDLAGVLAKAASGTTLLIDGLGTWLAAVLDEAGWNEAGWNAGGLDAGGLAARIAELVTAWRQTSAYVVAVSDETGLGVIPQTPAGRVFRDWLGRVNQALAAESEETELVVAGRVVRLEG